MADYDVLVVGGGPAGHAAALRAAELGARAALVERERLGGACVNHSCVPTDALLSAAAAYLNAQEIAVQGIIDAVERFNWSRAVARAEMLAARVREGVEASLRMAGVEVLRGRAAFTGPARIRVETEGGSEELTAEGVVIATGTRWEPPVISGFLSGRVITPDVLQRTAEVPRRVLVHEGSPEAPGFAVEYAFLLALAGSDVLLATAGTLLPALDGTVREVVRALLADLGVTLLEKALLTGAGAGRLAVRHAAGDVELELDSVVAADPRRPLVEGLGLEAAGVPFSSSGIPVDARCGVGVPGIFAAGDVTGAAGLSSVASHQGRVAGENACGGNATVRPDRMPRVLHLTPPVAWVGGTEEALRAQGRELLSGAVDLSFGVRAITLGAREGLVKVIADRRLGELLGVHVLGPEAAEIVHLAALAMQAEIPIDELASFVAWHPSASEALAAAAERALAQA